MPRSGERRYVFQASAVVVLALGIWLVWGRPSRPRMNSLGMALVPFPPGSFTVGSSGRERIWALDHGARKEWVAGEQDRGTATVARRFWMATTEVTIGQFRVFAEATNYRTVAQRGEGPLALVLEHQDWTARPDRSWEEPGFPHDDTFPAICLNWRDGQAFCRWLTEREQAEGRIGSGERYRLPAESEWEVACRAGSQTHYGWGDDVEPAACHANILDRTPLPNGSRWEVPTMSWTDGYAFTAPAGSFEPTSRDLYDLHGNAWEWCLRDGVEARNASDSDYLLRGGSWDNLPGNVRCASRRPTPPRFASDTTGFRVVLARE